MDTQEIIGKIQTALEKCSTDSSIDKKDIRIKLSIKKGLIVNDTRCVLMNKKDDLHEIDLRTLLNINPMQSLAVGKYLSSTLSGLAKKEGIKDTDVNARIFTKSEDFYPSVTLFNENKKVREITVEELTK
jgi:hypothetical protein